VSLKLISNIRFSYFNLDIVKITVKIPSFHCQDVLQSIYTEFTMTPNTTISNTVTSSLTGIKRPLGTFALILMTILSIAIGLYAFAFQARVAGDPMFHARFDEMYIASTMHIVGGGIVLLTGALQFWTRLRTRYINAHRWLGRTYLSFVLIGGIGGLILAPVSDGGIVAHFGFGLLAILWLFSGARAFTLIRNGRVQEHKEWMMRNYAMAFGAVTLRIYLGLFAANDIPFEAAYPATAWISWVPNLILVEWFLILRRERQPGVRNSLANAAMPTGA